MIYLFVLLIKQIQKSNKEKKNEYTFILQTNSQAVLFILYFIYVQHVSGYPYYLTKRSSYLDYYVSLI